MLSFDICLLRMTNQKVYYWSGCWTCFVGESSNPTLNYILTTDLRVILEYNGDYFFKYFLFEIILKLYFLFFKKYLNIWKIILKFKKTPFALECRFNDTFKSQKLKLVGNMAKFTIVVIFLPFETLEFSCFVGLSFFFEIFKNDSSKTIQLVLIKFLFHLTWNPRHIRLWNFGYQMHTRVFIAF